MAVFLGERVRLVLVELEAEAGDLCAKAAAEREGDIEAATVVERVRFRFGDAAGDGEHLR